MKKEPGHPPLLQTIVSSRAGHKAPPFSGFTLTSRSLILVPPLQVALHLPHGFQSPTLQSTRYPKLVKMKRWEEGTWASPRIAGHCLLQSRTHSSPFFLSSMTSRSLVLVPLLQVALHSPHGFHSSTLQSTENLYLEKMIMGIKKQDVVLSGGAEVASDIGAEVVTGTDPSEQVPDSSPTACIASLFSVSTRTLFDTPLTPRLVPVRGYIWSGLE